MINIMINIKVNMMIKIMMVALMFSHPCWPQPYETRIAIIHVKSDGTAEE